MVLFCHLSNWSFPLQCFSFFFCFSWNSDTGWSSWPHDQLQPRLQGVMKEVPVGVCENGDIYCKWLMPLLFKEVYNSLRILVCDWVLMSFIFLSPACRVRRFNFPCENITNVVITYLLDLGSPMELLWMNDKWVIFLTIEIWGLQFCWIHKVLR